MGTVPIRCAITMFSGFMQNLGSAGSGLVDIEHEAYQLCICRPDVRVRLFPWNTNEAQVAESLWRYRPLSNGTNPKQVHIVVGYSYGGDRAVKFCDQLKFRGDTTVSHLFLCDAVRRWDKVPGVAAFTGAGSLHLPDIVEKCTYFVQRNKRFSRNRPGGFYQPRGHAVKVAKGSNTKLDGPHVRDSGHTYIDNDFEFRQRVLDSVKDILAVAA